MTADVPDLTIAELEQIREATEFSYVYGDEEYSALPSHLLKIVEGDGGLVNMIDLVILRTRQLDALRAQVQQDYAAIHAKQQRDAERIRELEAALNAGEFVYADADSKPSGSRVDRMVVSPEALAKMLADESGPTPKLREAIARARQRREDTNG